MEILKGAAEDGLGMIRKGRVEDATRSLISGRRDPDMHATIMNQGRCTFLGPDVEGAYPYCTTLSDPFFF